MDETKLLQALVLTQQSRHFDNHAEVEVLRSLLERVMPKLSLGDGFAKIKSESTSILINPNSLRIQRRTYERSFEYWDAEKLDNAWNLIDKSNPCRQVRCYTSGIFGSGELDELFISIISEEIPGIVEICVDACIWKTSIYLSVGSTEFSFLLKLLDANDYYSGKRP